MKRTQHVRIGARFSPETNAWLEKQAALLAVPKSTLITVAVESWKAEESAIETRSQQNDKKDPQP